MILNLFSAWTDRLDVAAFLAAFMSGVSSYLNSTSTMFPGRRLHARLPSHRGRDVLDSHAMRVGRATTIVSILVACAAAPIFDEENVGKTIYNLIQTLMSIFYGPTLAIMLLGVLWKRANQWGANGCPACWGSARNLLDVSRRSTLRIKRALSVHHDAVVCRKRRFARDRQLGNAERPSGEIGRTGSV